MLTTDVKVLRHRRLSWRGEVPALNFDLSDPGVKPLGLCVEGVDLLRHAGGDDGELLDDFLNIEGKHLVHLSRVCHLILDLG